MRYDRGTMNSASRLIAVLSGKTATIGSYYYKVFALTPKESQEVTQQALQVEQGPLSQYFPVLATYAPFILFFALFVGAFGIQMLSKTKTIKRIFTAFVIALFAASVPFVLTATREGVDLRSKAGPGETPQNLKIIQDSPTSALVTWNTTEDKVGAVRMSAAPYDEKNSSVAIGDAGRQVKVHSIRLNNLSRRGTYELEILSGTLWYTDNGNPLKLELK